MPYSTFDVTETRADWQFMRRPLWLLSHVLVATLLTAMVFAGVWQVQRHGERSERNDVIQQRAALDPVEIGLVAPPGATDDDLQYTVVQATGEFIVEDEVLVRNRTLTGSPGYWVLTPLLTIDGWAVVVNRGWIPAAFNPGEDRLGTEPPSGVVTLLGTLQPSRSAGALQQADPATSRLTSLARPDLERFAQQLDYPISPVVLQLDPTRPIDAADGAGSNSGLPVPLSLPALDAGPHASYAAQWFIFSVIALVGYPIVLRRMSTGRGRSIAGDSLTSG